VQKKKGTSRNNNNNNNNNNRNTSYYKSQVKNKSGQKNKNGYNYLDKSKKRQISSYIRAVSVLFIFMILVTGFIFLGTFLKSVVENIDETTTENEHSINPPTQGIPTDALINEAENLIDNIPEIYNRYNGVYLDVLKLEDLESLQIFIDRIKAKDVNAVNIDIKTEDGIIPYQIGGQFTAIVGEENQIDLKIEDIINMLHENGLYVSGTVVCFKDHLAGTTFAMSALHETSTDMLWFDASGSAWLNIYTEGARDYIKLIVSETIKYGFDEIILSHFYLPNISNTGSVRYNGEGLSKSEAVTNFVRDIRGVIDDFDPRIKLGLNIPVRDFWTMPNETMGVRPDELANKCNFFTTSFAPADAPGVTLNISNPESKPYDTVKALCEHFKYLTDNVGFRPAIQGFNSYNDDDIGSQKQALREAGISVWTLVNFDNIY